MPKWYNNLSMANSISYKETSFMVGDMITVSYKIKEGTKERQQLFQGILTKIKGDNVQDRMITVRKISNIGLGVERIIPLNSPFIGGIKLIKKSNYTKAKLYFLPGLSGQKLNHKLYKNKKNCI